MTPYIEDEVVLGTWISGGVVISTNSFRRLSILAGWMSPLDLAEIIQAAGFQVPDNVGILIEQRTRSQEGSEERMITTTFLNDQPDKTRQKNKNKDDPRKFVLPGRSMLEDFFNDHVIDIIFNAKKYQAMGIDFPSAIALHGPPGCGKTFAVERLVEFIDWPSYSIDSSSIGSPYIHATSKKISDVFNKAIDTAPSVIIIDEMEAFLSDRWASGDGLHHVEEVAEFLRRIPEANDNKVLIIAMTNRIDLIDPAVLRRGRFDHIVAVVWPSREEVAMLFNSLLDKLPISNNLELDKIVDKLTGKPLSDLTFVIRDAARLAAKASKSQIDQQSLSDAFNNLPEDSEKNRKPIGFI